MHGVMEYKMIFNSLEVIDDVVNKNNFFCSFLLEGHRFVFEVSCFSFYSCRSMACSPGLPLPNFKQIVAPVGLFNIEPKI